MKNKLYLSLFLVVLMVGVFLIGTNQAQAVGNAYFPQATTLQLTIGGTVHNFTISAGSDADSITVNASSFALTMSTGRNFTVTSTDRLRFNPDNSSYGGTTCTDSTSSLTISGATTSTVITVTPSGTCASAGSGGGGGGGSSVATTTPTTTPVVTGTVTPTPTTVSVVSPTPFIYPVATPTPVPSATSIQVLSSIKKLNVRKGAGVNFGVLGQIKGSDIYQKLGEKSGWIKIQFGGKEGWVIKTYIKSL